MCKGDREMTVEESIKYMQEKDKEIEEIILDVTMSSLDAAIAIQKREGIILGHLNRLSILDRHTYVIGEVNRVFNVYRDTGRISLTSRNILGRLWDRMDTLITLKKSTPEVEGDQI